MHMWQFNRSVEEYQLMAKRIMQCFWFAITCMHAANRDKAAELGKYIRDYWRLKFIEIEKEKEGGERERRERRENRSEKEKEKEKEKD